MQVVLESPSALERQFKITIPTGDIETEFEAKLAETAKRVRIDGFSSGQSAHESCSAAIWAGDSAGDGIRPN